jgi:hypothetical protein
VQSGLQFSASVPFPSFFSHLPQSLGSPPSVLSSHPGRSGAALLTEGLELRLVREAAGARRTKGTFIAAS